MPQSKSGLWRIIKRIWTLSLVGQSLSRYYPEAAQKYHIALQAGPIRFELFTTSQRAPIPVTSCDKWFMSTYLKALRLAFMTVLGLLAVAIVLPNLFPAHEGSPPSCINNLRLIESAKNQWALENNKTNSDVPTWADIQLYFGRGGSYLPKCPLGGTYVLGTLSNKPVCSYPAHVLP